jgi:hypothetical protein
MVCFGAFISRYAAASLIHLIPLLHDMFQPSSGVTSLVLTLLYCCATFPFIVNKHTSTDRNSAHKTEPRGSKTRLEWKSNDLIRNRTRDLPACSIVLQVMIIIKSIY